MSYMTPADLENAASGLSNFGGQLGYSGSGDEFLDFGGDNGSFVDSIAKGRVYNLQVINGGSVTNTLLLCPGLISTAQGLMQQGNTTSVEGNAGGSGGLICNGQPGSVNFLNASIQRFPMRILGFKLTCANLSQLEQNFIIQKESPFKTHGSEVINPSIYASESNPNTGLLTINYEFQMDSETKVSYPILAGTTVNIGFVIGALLKPTSALTRKAAAGSVTKSFMGGR